MRRSAWIFNHYASPPDRGAGTRHYDLGVEMAAYGWDVTIFAAGFSHFTGREERLAPGRARRIERTGSPRFVWLRTLPYRGNDWRRVANMVSYAVMAIVGQLGMGRPDVVVGSTVHPLAALTALIVARGRRVPFVFEIRDLWPQTLVDMGRLRRDSVATRLLYALEARLVTAASAVVTLLPGVPSYLAARGLPTDHVTYVPNGTRLGGDTAPVPPVVADHVDRAHRQGRLIAAYAGVHGDINRLDVVVQAARRCSDLGINVDLLLIGDGPEKPRLRRLAHAIGAQTVTFLDPVPKREILAALGSVDMTIFHLADTPVLRFGVSSNKLFDYLAAGRPIVFACRSGNDPVAEAGAGVSVEPDDPEAMAEALAHLARLEATERERMGAHGRAYATRHHDITVLASRFAEVLDRVAR